MTIKQKKEFLSLLLKGQADASSIQPARMYNVLSCNGLYDVTIDGEAITLDPDQYKQWLQTLRSKDVVFVCSIERYCKNIPAHLTPTKAFMWMEQKQYGMTSELLN